MNRDSADVIACFRQESGVHKGGLVKGGLAIRHVFNLHVFQFAH